MYTVITEYKAWGTPLVAQRQFDSLSAAQDYIVEEIFQKDTLRVRCPELDLEEVGEFC